MPNRAFLPLLLLLSLACSPALAEAQSGAVVRPEGAGERGRNSSTCCCGCGCDCSLLCLRLKVQGIARRASEVAANAPHNAHHPAATAVRARSTACPCCRTPLPPYCPSSLWVLAFLTAGATQDMVGPVPCGKALADLLDPQQAQCRTADVRPSTHRMHRLQLC